MKRIAVLACGVVLAVTFGYKLGPMLGGRGQISVKPLVLVGHNAPSDWGVQLAFQLLGL